MPWTRGLIKGSEMELPSDLEYLDDMAQNDRHDGELAIGFH